MIVNVDSMPLHLLEYLYVWHTDEVEQFNPVPVLLNGGLAIQEFADKDKSKSTCDYYIGEMGYRRKSIIRSKHKDYEYIFAELTSKVGFGVLVLEHHVSIQFNGSNVLASCGEFSAQADNYGAPLAALKATVKHLLKSEQATVSPEIMAVMDEYTKQESARMKEILDKREERRQREIEAMRQ